MLLFSLRLLSRLVSSLLSFLLLCLPLVYGSMDRVLYFHVGIRRIWTYSMDLQIQIIPTTSPTNDDSAESSHLLRFLGSET